MKIGYIRSEKKSDSFHEEQKKHLEGCERIFEDFGDSITELDHMVDYIRADDHIHVYQLDRFGLNIRDLMTLIYDFLGKGIHVYSLQDGIDTATHEGRTLLKVFKVLNMCEQNAVTQSIGLTESATAQNSLGQLMAPSKNTNNITPLSQTRDLLRNAGRPKGLSPQAKEKAETAAAMYQEGSLSMRDIAQNLNISTATLYSYLRHEKVI